MVPTVSGGLAAGDGGHWRTLAMADVFSICHTKIEDCTGPVAQAIEARLAGVRP